MKKLLFLTLFIAGAVFNSKAQSDMATVTMGTKTKASFFTYLDDIVYSDKSGVIATIRKKSKVSLEKYNMSMNLETSMPIKLKLKLEAGIAEYKYCIAIGGKLYAFYDLHSKKEKRHQYLLYNIDLGSLIMSDSYTVIEDITYTRVERVSPGMALAGMKGNSGSANIIMSEDSTRFLVLSEIPGDKNDVERFKISVYDDQLNKKWSKEVEIPYPAMKIARLKVEIDEEFNVYYVGRFKDSKRAEEVDYVIFRFDEKNDTGKELIISNLVDSYKLKDFNFFVNGTTGEIYATGFYLSPDKKDKLNGAYFYIIDKKNLTVAKKKYYPAAEILAKVNETADDIDDGEKTKKEERKEKREANSFDYSYDLRKIVYKEGGGLVAFFEIFYFYTTTTTTTDSQGRTTTRTTYHYEYNDIIIVNLDEKGELLWARKIPKFQHTRNDGGYNSSFATFLNGDMIYLIFNDNKRNSDAESNGKIYPSFGTRKNLTTSIVSIDPKGNIKRESLMPFTESEVLVVPKQAVQIEDKKMIIYGRYNVSQRFFSIDLK